MNLYRILTLLCLVGAMGCGSLRVKTFSSEEVATGGVKEGLGHRFIPRIECGKDGCNKSVVLIISTPVKGAPGVARCSGFLTDNDVVVTAAHCIPEDLLKGDGACFSRMAAVFPNGNRLIECKRILFAGERSTDFFPDVAAIQLMHSVTEKPLQISRDGFSLDEDVRVVTMVMNKSRAGEAAQSVKSCTTRNPDVGLNLSFKSKGFRTVKLNDCPLQPGNSGSPVFSRDGKVKGVAVMTAPPHLKHSAFFHQGEAQRYSYVQNLSCYNFPPYDGEILDSRDECTDDYPFQLDSDDEANGLFAKMESEREREIIKDALRHIRSDSPGLAKTFDWGLIGPGIANEAIMLKQQPWKRTPVPTCIKQGVTRGDDEISVRFTLADIWSQVKFGTRTTFVAIPYGKPEKYLARLDYKLSSGFFRLMRLTESRRGRVGEELIAEGILDTCKELK